VTKVNSTQKSPALLGYAVASLVAVSLCVVPAPTLADDETSGTVSVMVGGPMVSDDDAAFQTRNGVPADVWGGVERLELERSLDDDTALSFTGRALVERNDYLADLSLVREGLGFLEAGYEEYRQWEDGTGDFYPAGNGGAGQVVTDLFDEELALDRGRAWLRGGLRKDSLPELTFEYRYRFRDGQKDSSAHGVAGTSSGPRNIAGAFTDVDEARHTVDIEIRQAFDDANVGAGVRYDHAETDNARNMTLRPDEPTLDRRVTQRDSIENDTLSARAFGDKTFLDERVMVSGMASTAKIDSDVAGSRIFGAVFGANFDPALANRQAFDRGFLDLDSHSDVYRHSFGLNAVVNLRDDLRFLMAGTFEADDSDSEASFTETVVESSLGLPTGQGRSLVSTDSDSLTFTQRAELRYTGIDDVSLYARAELEEVDGSLNETQTDVGSGDLFLDRDTDINILGQRFAGGLIFYPGTVNFLPGSGWNMAAEYVFSDRDSDFDHNQDVGSSNLPGDSNDIGSTNRFPAYITAQNNDTHKWTARSAFRPCSDLRLGLRYGFELSSYDSRADGLDEYNTTNAKTHRVATTATWNPVDYAYVQSELNYVDSEIDSPADDLEMAAEGLVADFDNSYWSGRVSSGLALDADTQVDLMYSFLSASNFDRPATPSAVAYGTDIEEHSVVIGLLRRLSETTRVRAKYGYVNSQGEREGGRNDYDASIIQAALELDF
jgi:hypothetical protein